MNELAHIPLSTIERGDRYRKDFGDLDALTASIAERGLITPLAVEQLPGGRYLLLAGERRLCALERLGHADVPVRIFPEGTSALERRLIELAENVDRKSMEWKEQCFLTEEIHRLHQEIHGETMPGSTTAGGWGVKDTAKVAGVSHPVVIQEIAIARAVKEAPELFEGCKTKADAEKVMRKVEEAMILDELAKRTVAKQTSLPTSTQHLIDAYNVGDFFEGVRQLPSSIFNWVELDPDFAIDVKDLRGAVAGDSAYQQVTRIDFPSFFTQVVRELKRVMADHGWVVCWYGFEWTSFVRDAFEKEGFSVSNTPGVWLKDKVTGVQNQPYMNFDPQTELFMLVRKGSPTLNRPGRSNVFTYPRLHTSEKLHPFERPLELMKEILTTIAFPGTRGLVPFLGSGKTLVAAQHLGMNALGFELSREYKDKYTVALAKGEGEWRLR